MKQFACDYCGGTVRKHCGPGRFTMGNVPIPDDMPLMTCDRCGERYLSMDDCQALGRLEREFDEAQRRPKLRLVKP